MKIIAPPIEGRPLYNAMLRLKDEVHRTEKVMPLKLSKAHTEFDKIVLRKQLMLELRQMKDELKQLQFLAWDEGMKGV